MQRFGWKNNWPNTAPAAAADDEDVEGIMVCP